MAGNSPLKNLFYVIGAITGKNVPPNMAQIPISNPNLKMESFTEDEYLAMTKWIHVSIELNIANLDIYSDSELIVNQINGKYKVNNDRMKQLQLSVMFELN